MNSLYCTVKAVKPQGPLRSSGFTRRTKARRGKGIPPDALYGDFYRCKAEIPNNRMKSAYAFIRSCGLYRLKPQVLLKNAGVQLKTAPLTICE
jgi:hypothetical protein